MSYKDLVTKTDQRHFYVFGIMDTSHNIPVKRPADNSENQNVKKSKSVTKADAAEYFKTKIETYIYVFTGCKEVHADIVSDVEKRLKSYLLELKCKAEKSTTKRKKSKLNVNDMYEALRNSPEYYGAKRCLIIKKLSRKVEKVGTLDIVDVVDVAEDILENAGEVMEDVDRDLKEQTELYSELEKLNDGTLEYKKFEADRLEYMRSAADLTDEMDREEYTAYYKFKTKKFIGKSRHTHFCLWMDWNTSLPTDDVFIIIGWLSVTKIRSILKKALKKRYDEPRYNTLFAPPTIQIDKNIPLHPKYFLNNAKYAGYSDKHLKAELSTIFNETNEKFAPPHGKQRTDIFSLIKNLREEKQLKKKETESKILQQRLFLQKQMQLQNIQRQLQQQKQLQQRQLQQQQQPMRQYIQHQPGQQYIQQRQSLQQGLNFQQSLDDEVLQLLSTFNS